jgi:hypothetical protein
VNFVAPNMVFFNGRMNGLRKKKGRGIYSPSRKCSCCSPRGGISGSSEPEYRSQEYPAPRPNIQPKYLPPSRKLHAQVLSEISRGPDNLALGQIIRPIQGAADPCSTWSLALSSGTRIIHPNTEIFGLIIWVSFEPLLFFLFSFGVDVTMY